ncbi:SDR family oxidoreductase [Sedimentibacter hydroxybenzoicus DSM 7310]|uniref:SDR family oxidoreductase n=1 Tax=Sedimentibacter hydroxybenzoicus DSM 7310 TaxID=1123245 RepID=A0A974GY44_SEDHY|nr:SDR family oxidoreductase [Sedimentibacter hydroxybenzoicus]NYB75760.1 SDR family oxidoreductase [Sedimentibacter hydroxybenzoicus DSM 7310]
MRLKDKIAVITGSAGGIGAAVAIKFAENGANVALWDVNEAGLKEMEEKLSSYGVKAKGYKTNITDYKEVQEIGLQVIQDFGRVDILINCAGGGRDIALGLRELDDEKWDRLIDLNMTSMFNCTKAVIENMVENKYGKIVNFSSVAGLRGGGLLGKAAYATAKAGVIGFTKAVAKECAPYGIYCNAIAPSLHVTPLIEANMGAEQIEELKNSFLLKTAGDPSKLAELVVFLASDDAQFITASLYMVDGGFSYH